MSRKRYLNETDPFASVDKGSDTSATAIDAELFGAIQKSDTHRQSAAPVSIFEIFPDPAQPRRTVPSIVRKHWSGEPQTISEMFAIWIEQVADERGISFPIAEYLASASDVARPDEIGPLEENLLELIELAISIKNEGLTNPITVAPMGLSYRLETGERRWMAYHLLFAVLQDDAYSRIAARTVDSLNIWRQAAENNARANLNAISKARQLSVLLMDLMQTSKGLSFEPFGQFEHEQDYYAQIADGNDYKAPKNSSERLLAAMGLKHAKQIRDYRALLKLPHIVWQLADDLNWTEYFIRSLREKANEDNDRLISLAIREAQKQGYTAPTGTVSGKRGAAKPARSQPASDENEGLAPGSRQYYTHFSRLLRKTGPGKGRANEEAMNQLREFRVWLDEQEMLLGRYMKE